MADVPVIKEFVIDAVNRYIIGSPSAKSGSLLIHIDNDNTLAGASIAVEGRARGTSFGWEPIPYVRLSLAGTASDGTVVSAALTDTAIIQIPVADGLEVSLDVTTATSITGSASARAVPSTL